MKNYIYTKPWPADFGMQHEHETVDEWLSEVADVEESLDFFRRSAIPNRNVLCLYRRYGYIFKILLPTD